MNVTSDNRAKYEGDLNCEKQNLNVAASSPTANTPILTLVTTASTLLELGSKSMSNLTVNNQDKMTSANNANGQSLDCKKQNLIDAIRSANPDGKKGTPNPRLLTLKPGDTIKLFDHVLSRKNKEFTVQKIDSTNPNCPIELDDFFLSAMIEDQTSIAITKCVSEDGNAVSVDERDIVWSSFCKFYLVNGEKKGYVSLPERLRKFGDKFWNRVKPDVMPANLTAFASGSESSGSESSDSESDVSTVESIARYNGSAKKTAIPKSPSGMAGYLALKLGRDYSDDVLVGEKRRSTCTKKTGSTQTVRKPARKKRKVSLSSSLGASVPELNRMRESLSQLGVAVNEVAHSIIILENRLKRLESGEE
jgi:hypothetical protein